MKWRISMDYILILGGNAMRNDDGADEYEPLTFRNQSFD